MAVSEDLINKPGALQNEGPGRGCLRPEACGGDSNRWDTKEGCAERIARCGTLSQNGYGDDKSALAGANKAARSESHCL